MNELSLHGVAEILRKIAADGGTGIFRVGASGHLRMAFFEDGALVYVVSEAPDDALAGRLSRPGRLESPEARATLARLETEVSRTKSLVSLVLERRLVDAETLRTWLVEYAYEVFSSIFASRDATAKFMVGPSAAHPLPYRLPVAQLVLEAAEHIRNPEVVREAIGPTNYYTEPALSLDEIAALPLSFHDGRVISLVEGPIAIQEIVAIAGLPEIDTLRSILALRLVGALTPFYEYRVTDTGKLRMRKAALESGVAVDAEAAAAALGFRPTADESNRPVSMGEMQGNERYTPPASPPRAPSSAGGRSRVSTGQLRSLSRVAYIQMGKAEAASGNFAAAVQCFETALSEDPNDAEVLVAFAEMQAGRPGGVPAAEELLERAVDAHPRAIAPLIALARLYQQSGRDDDAEEALLEARRIEPNSAAVRRALEQFRSRGGFLSKLKLRSDRPSKITPPAPAPPRPAPRQPSASGSGIRCRYCGRPFDHEVRVCRSCGATL
jgi:tetratricopeptide (TPR) repeat protein